LLTKTKITRVVELSSVRKLVFKDADAPAVILTYSFGGDIPSENWIEHISMKPNQFFKLFNVVVTEKTDIKYIQQSFLASNDWVWKTLVYGLSGDIDTIMRLKTVYPMLRECIALQKPKIEKGDGVQYNDGDLQDASHLFGRPLLNSRTAINHFVLFENETTLFTKKKIHRTRDEALFHAPYCLVLRGIDTADYTMRAVYSEIDFVFKHAIYAIKGTFEQKDFLLKIVGLLNSTLYAYFNLMLGSSLGIEREQRQMDEVLDFPFVQSVDIAKQVEVIQEMSKQKEFSVALDVSGKIETLNKMILEAFNLSDNLFIDYALNVQMPLLINTTNCAAFQAVNEYQLSIYVKPFLEALSAVYGMSGRFVAANIYPTVAKYYSAIEVVLYNDKPLSEIQILDDIDSQQSALTRFSAHKINDMFFMMKDIIHFEEDSFYIIKSNYYKNWHPAIAQLDLADVVDQILSKNGGNN
jgi:hypothetical protein